MSAMTSTTSMTAIDYAALAERLEAHAECHANVEPFDDEQRQWADDLRTVATMLEGMADAKPVGMFIKFGKPGDESYDLASRKYWGDPDLVPLYLHPAPQPQPEKCGCRSCLTPAERLCTFVVCPTCGNKRCPRADDHRNACTGSNDPGQPQPERQPVSEPTEAQHPDDAAVDRFAAAMKAKLAEKRAEGRGGWDDPEQCSTTYLATLLRGHVAKGDPLDVGNFAMMLWNRGGATNEAVDPGIPDLRLTEAQIEQERSEQAKDAEKR